MDKLETPKPEWNNRKPQEAAFHLIEDFKNKYAKSYQKGAKRFERLYYAVSILTILLGIVVAGLAVLNRQENISESSKEAISLGLVLLPIITTGLVALSTQFGLKEKYSLRETARIEASFYYNVARAKYYESSSDGQYLELYKWLTGIIKEIQDNQRRGYMDSIKDISSR